MRTANAFDAATVARISERIAEPGWLAERRRDAFERFASLPWPDQSVEEWRHTDLRTLDVESFDPLPPAHPKVGSLEEIDPGIRARQIGEKGDRHGLAIQLDADVVHTKLAPNLVEQGVIFAPLARAAEEHPELVEAAIGRAGVSEFEAKIEAWNAAFRTGGLFLYVPRGVQVEMPLQSVRWTTRGGIATFPRVIVVADEASSVTYIDHYGSESLTSAALQVAAIEIYAHQAAQVTYLAVQDVAQACRHFTLQRSLIGRDATVRSLSATLGGGLSRAVVQSVLEGRGAHAEMLGVYFGDHDQHIDYRTLQRHVGEDTSSELTFKGALKGSSRAVYSGLVDIEKDAHRSDAQQSNRNILLSDGASALPEPFLEIKTSEVARATHGVSVGRPDPEVLFYLQSRGLDAEDAEHLYVKGFFQEVIDRVRVQHVREALEDAVEAELALES